VAENQAAIDALYPGDGLAGIYDPRTGRFKALQTDTPSFPRNGSHGEMNDSGVEVHVLETKAAAELYNRLTDDTPVGGLFHSTC
jgi:hypothetical protein